MADQKITDLTALTTPDAGDLLAIVDDPGGTPVTKKITVADLLGGGAAPSVLFANGATSGNPADTSEDTLYSYTLPAGELANDGDSLDIEYVAITDANSTTKRVRIKFGGTVVADSDYNSALGNTPNYLFSFRVTVVRRSGTTQVASARQLAAATNSNMASGVPPVLILEVVTTPGETLSGTVAILFTGQSPSAGAANAVVGQYARITKYPAP